MCVVIADQTWGAVPRDDSAERFSTSFGVVHKPFAEKVGQVVLDSSDGDADQDRYRA